VRLYGLRPRIVRLDAGYWGLRLIAWIHTVLGAVAVVPWNPKRQKNRSCLPPTWTAEELGKRTSIERFFGRVFSLFGCFRLQRPPLCGWSQVASRRRLDLCGDRRRCLSRPAGRASGLHSVPQTGAGAPVGTSRVSSVARSVTLARRARAILGREEGA
jgi:hypothetical protein